MKIKRLISVICAMSLCLSFAGCSKDRKEAPKKVDKTEEINQAYDEAIKDNKEETINPHENPITDSFTSWDFTFSSMDDTVAFTLSENSFAKITPTASYFNFLDKTKEPETFEGTFKTAKGMSLANPVSEFVSVYKLDKKDMLYIDSVAKRYEYPTSSMGFKECLSVALSSKDGENFSQMSAKDLQTILQIRHANSEGVYFDQKLITDKFPDVQTIALIDFKQDSMGNFNEFVFYRIDNDTATKSTK